jgi:N-acyl-L-homoserine lactone synthetase
MKSALRTPDAAREFAQGKAVAFLREVLEHGVEPGTPAVATWTSKGWRTALKRKAWDPEILADGD